MDRVDFEKLMNEISKIRLSNSMGSGYSYEKTQIWEVLNANHCYEIMSDLSNKESSYGTTWTRIDQDELLHSIENLTGYSTYAYSKQNYDDCMRSARDSYEAMEKKAMLDYSDKKHSDVVIQEIAFGISIRQEKEWHLRDSWSDKVWYVKRPLIIDSHICGANNYFDHSIDR